MIEQVPTVVSLEVYYFTEGDVVLLTCPALDYTGCGHTETEAEESLSIMIDEYFDYTVNKKTLDADLVEHGWTITHTNHEFIAIPPTEEQLVQRIPEFAELLAEGKYRKAFRKVEFPVAA